MCIKWHKVCLGEGWLESVHFIEQDSLKQAGERGVSGWTFLMSEGGNYDKGRRLQQATPFEIHGEERSILPLTDRYGRTCSSLAHKSINATGWEVVWGDRQSSWNTVPNLNR